MKNALEKININDKDFEVLERLQESKMTIEKKAYLILRALLLRDDFKPFISKTRREEKIPIGGYKKDENDIGVGHGFYKKKKLISPLILGEDCTWKIRLYLSEKKIFTVLPTKKKSVDVHKLLFIEGIIKSYILCDDVFSWSLNTVFIELEKSKGVLGDSLVCTFPVAITENEFSSIWQKIKMMRKSEEMKMLKNKSDEKIKRKRNTASAYNFKRDVEIYNRYVEVVNDKKNKVKGLYLEKQLANEFSDEKYRLTESAVGKVIERMRSLLQKSDI